MTDRIYKTFLAIAGIQIPFISASVGSRYGSISNLNIEVNYSPYITHIHEYSKVQLWEQIIESDGSIYEPTLEFDGVVIGIVRSKSVLGNVSARLTCLTDGVIWNQRKQYDFYISQLLNIDTRLNDTVKNMRVDGQITNYYGDLLSSNKFDIGCCVGSVLTSYTKAKVTDDSNSDNVINTSVTYIYNGKKYFKYLTSADDDSVSQSTTPAYYDRFLSTYKLQNKLYGISTSVNVQQFFQTDRFIQMVSQTTTNDLQGENTFWNIATNVMQYGFYSVYDIPNPTYIPVSSTSPNTNGSDLSQAPFIPEDGDENTTQVPNVITVTNNTSFAGLAEYILKPISVLGLPLKCNIIWPNQVISESLFYDTINTPTRIIMQKTACPLQGNDNVLLTTTKIAGPYISNCQDFFKSFTPPVTDSGYKNIRPGEIYSEYEKEYGMRYTEMNLSYAFESSLLESKTSKLAEQIANNVDTENAVALKINNFLNYEFSQRFFAARNYSIQVTPDVDCVPGLPIIVLNQNGEHIICFCTGKTKSWDNRGSKNVSLEVGYPRYYYENIDGLGNIVDPTAVETLALKELETLFGSEALVRNSDGTPATSINSDALRVAIDQLFTNYVNGKITLSDYERSTCTYTNFLALYGQKAADKFNVDDSYLETFFESSDHADQLSCHQFYVDQSPITNLSNQEIILNHLTWVSKAQRI